MNRDDWNDLMETARREHRAPPPVPRERLWERVDATRAPQRRIVRPRFPLALRWTAAAAAVLAAGLLLGRIAAEGPAPLPAGAPVTVAADTAAAAPERLRDAPTGANALYDRVTVAVLDRADALLTDFRTRACTGAETADGREGLKTWAGSLLSETRLMMNTPVGDDPELRRLLQELELVLAQLSSLNAARCEDDSAWIVAGMDRRDTLERLRTVAASRRDRIAL